MDWFYLTLILSCIAATLILSLKAITPETNPFLFMAWVTGIACVTLVLYCWVNDISLVISQPGLALAIVAGISVAILDLAFIFMFRKGATVSVTMPLFRVAAITISAIVGMVVFSEQLNTFNVCGIMLACVAVYLLYSKPKGLDS